MCRPASFVVTRTQVLWDPDGDNHEAILKRSDLPDRRDMPDFVRVELCPRDEDYSRPLSEWQYRRDQDRIPNWYTDAYGEAVCRAELPRWAGTHILPDGGECRDGQTRIVLGGIVHVSGGECYCYDQSQSHEQAGGACYCYDQSQSHEQAGGACSCYNQSQSHEQAGGECYCYDQSQAHGQKGGVCHCFDGSQAHGQTGGKCYTKEGAG